MKRIILLSIIIINSLVIQSQNVLTIDEAINIALKNNFDIWIARNDVDAAKLNNTLGNSGMLPGVSITGSDNYAVNSIDQKLSSGSEITASNAKYNTFSAGAFVNWNIFDGGKMFITKNKLNEIQVLGELQYKDKVMQTIYNVIAAYYDIVRQTQQLNSLNEVINYNKERVKILQTSYDAGLIPKNNLLQSKIDLNVYSENALNQLSVITASKRSLNQLLCRDAGTVLDVTDSIPNSFKLNKEELLSKMYASNTTLLSLQKQIDISKLTISEFNSYYFPKVSLFGGYNFTESNNSAGSILINRINGPQIGGSFTIPLYQSGNIKRQKDVAKLQLKSSQYYLESVKIQLNVQLQNVITVYESQLNLLNIEKENADLTKENLDIVMERLRLGQTTVLEVRQAQESFVDSQTRLINLKYNLKLAETKLKQLIAGL
ncbi:MAG: TolC family protein [Bacteroidota bacterium]